MFPKLITSLLLASTFVSSVCSTPLRLDSNDLVRRGDVTVSQPPPSSTSAQPSSTAQPQASAKPKQQSKTPPPPPKAQSKPSKITAKPQGKSMSFNGYNGLSSMSGFDGFNGAGNFDGSKNRQVIIEKQVEVCHAEQIEIVQQRLAVIKEIAKRIVTELVCDVETQVIVFEQFHRGMGQFHNDMRRQNGRQGGYDSSVAGHVSHLVDASGNLTNDDLGFNGSDVGSQTVVPGGTNWNNSTSPGSTLSALNAAISASTSNQ